jgi:hypothetical protein
MTKHQEQDTAKAIVLFCENARSKEPSMKSWKALVSVAFLIAVLGFVLYATLPHSRGGYRFEDAAQVVVDDIARAIHVYRMQQGEFPVNESADSEIWSSSILPLLLATNPATNSVAHGD